MSKWYVEFKAYGKQRYIRGIEAEDGKAAIEYVKAHVIGATRFKVWHDDDDDE
jgi:hypothetical protein